MHPGLEVEAGNPGFVVQRSASLDLASEDPQRSLIRHREASQAGDIPAKGNGLKPSFNGKHLTGGCQCGAIRYRISGKLTKPHVCHCRMCQKAVGAPFWALAEIDIAAFAWTRGEPAWFRSSEAVERGFCAQCGTSLHFRYVGADRLDIALASLDDPNAIAPEQEFGCESRLEWLDRIGTLPQSTTEATTPQAALRTYASRQHPDHD